MQIKGNVQELIDQLESMQNVILAAHFLLSCGKFSLLPTQLEYLHQLSQEVIERYCIVDDF